MSGRLRSVGVLTGADVGPRPPLPGHVRPLDQPLCIWENFLKRLGLESRLGGLCAGLEALGTLPENRDSSVCHRGSKPSAQTCLVDHQAHFLCFRGAYGERFLAVLLG